MPIKTDNNIKTSKKDIMIFSGYMLNLSLSLVMFYTFIVAYLHPSKKVVVDINSIGEAHVELFLIFIVLDFILIGLYYSYKRLGEKQC